MPRGDGKPAGEPRTARKREHLGQYIPKNLKNRLEAFENGSGKSPTEMHRPGSQNPRSR